ncbi:kinase-like domain-containing protein [Cyathus striatus]|nr:kinase-like domain-containing protein [Cyathus striatus]
MGLLLECENHYYVGGFHPMNIGDTLNDHYRLVEDLLLKCFGSLKVLSANSSANSSELSISQHLQQQEKGDSHPGKDHVIRIFDTFIIQGPNGTHHCIVTELLGISLSSDAVQAFYRKNRFKLPPDVTRKLAAQVALGVAYLHKCNIIHGYSIVDLHLGNVLFYSPEFENASLTELNLIYWEPSVLPIQYWNDKTPVPLSIHRPATIAHPGHQSSLAKICLSSNIHVKICDFGESSFYTPYRQSNKPLTSNMSIVFQAPEVIFHDMVYPAPSMDIWALGVLMYMILNDMHVPFKLYYDEEKEAIQCMVTMLGRFLDKWWNAWAERAEYFQESGICLRTKWMVPYIRIGIVGKESFSVEEDSAFGGLLYKMFNYAPEERIDAEEAVRLIPSSWKDVVRN